MTRRVFVLLVLMLVSAAAFAQDKEKKKKIARPDIPGEFLFDFGFNRARLPPPNFKQGFWGSRTVNLYYQYPIRFGHSGLSIVPGLGLGMDRFKLVNNYTLSNNKDADGTFPLVDGKIDYPGIKRSQLIANYLDFPLGFRFDTHPEDISRSFNITVGGRVGVLYDAFTKITYHEDGENKVVKDKQWHGMNQFRYGLYTRFGGGAFNVFTYYNLSPLFAKGKGPASTNMTTWQIGISINGF